MRLRCNQQSHQPDTKTFDITIHFHGDVLIHLRLIEEFFRRQTVLASWTLKELALKPRPKYYEDSVQVVVYRLQLQGSVLSAEYSQQKLLENWCQQMPLWALPTLPHHLLPTASWERSHEIQLCELSIGNVVGNSIFCEHHRLGSALSVFDHSAQTLSMFLERANVGVLRMVVRYNQIRKMLVTLQDHNHVYLLLHMRAVSLVSFVDNKQLESHLASSSGELRLEDITTYQRKHDLDTFDPSFPTATEFGSCLTISLHARGATATLNNLISRVSRKVSHYGEVAYCRVERRLIHPVDRARLRAVQEAFIPLLKSFEIKYAVCALFSWSNEIIDQLFTYNRVQEVLALIRALELKSSYSLNLALEDVFTSLENGAIIAFEAALEMLFTEHYSFDGIAREMPVSGTVYVRRVFVTPTRMILRFADLHTQNRILRHFDSEYAIRVCFRDDNLDKLTFSVLNMREKLPFLNHVVGDHIRSGITIGGRKYMYVAASSSQLRDHGVWFYALDPSGFDAASIRQWMGDFSNISNVATRMARMGQCFSSTQETVEVTPLEEVHEDDIWYPECVHPTSKKPYCFSDGCGKISRSLLEEVWGSLPHIVSQPSALQIRYRGCKGMVCLDPSLEGRQLVLRKSMVKFECNSNRKLEVIKWSAPMNMFLNRPFIAILEHHGVKIDVFLRLELEMILQIADSLVCEASALRVLTSFVKTPIPFYGLAETGWQLVQDPFFTQMLFDLLKTSLISLKEKANIAIPVNEGRNMLGVVDETGRLQYGQVFIQFTEMPYSDISQARTRIVEADVVVTKCPCLHPGDVRRLRAVDIPELHHIRDCIVFPSNGKAPHPFEMSGSDLDGDEYICIWKEDLIFKENVEPHLYDDKPLGVMNPYQRPIHEVSFLCSYIANDMIGIISNAHLAWADQSGLISEKCLALVDKASKALDFAKTGHSVDLHPNEKPEKFPDFMEKGDHKHSYQSNKALGILYRTVRQIMSVNDTQLSSGHKFSPLEVPGWQMFREDAHTAMRRYNQRLANIMDQHGIMSEGEVFSGRIGTLNTFDASRAEKASVALLVERQKTALMEETKEQFFAELKNDCIVLGAHAAEDRRMLRLQKASSWFMAAYALQPLTEGAFYSFPWCIAHVLLEAKWWLRQTYPSMLTVHELSECRENILVRVIDERLGNFSLVTSHQRVRAHLTEWLGRLDRGSRIEHAHSVGNLHTAKDSIICAECFETIYRSFADAIALPKQLTTVGEYIVNFLTFLACGKCVYPSECSRATCRRFLSSDCPLLTVEASKAYVRFAINKDPCFLGLPCDQGVHKVNNIIMDAPPEKINISEKLHRFLAADEGRQCAELLSRWTGVQHISIRFHHRHHHRGVRYSSLRSDQDNCEDANSADGDRTCCSIKVHYCGTDAQIFAMQQILRSENLQRALVEDRGDLLSRER